jgi:hypothetical protein
MWKIGIGAVILGLVQVSAATASPVTYTFDGTGAVTLNSVSLGDTFSIVFTGDTSPIDSSGNPLFSVGTFTDGSVTESMTATLVANADPT